MTISARASLLAASALAGALAASPAAAADRPATCASLWATVKAAQPGDAVLLAGGPCAAQAFTATPAQFNFAAPGVTIRPADPKAPPVLAGLTLSGVTGLNVEGLEIAWSGAPQYPVSVAGGGRIVLRGLNVHGASVAAGGLGVLIRNATGVTLANSTIHDLGSGLSLVDDASIILDHDTVHDLARDGILIAGSSDVTVSDNTLYGFTPAPGDHPDAIQFFATAAHPAPGPLTFKDNLILRAPGQPPQNQGIFGASAHDVTIRGNTIGGAMYNGISIAGVTRAEIDHNFVQGLTDMWSGIVARTSDQVSIHDNAENAISIVPGTATAPGVTNLTQVNNVTVPQAATLDPAALARAQAKIGAPTPTPPSPAPDPNLAIIAGLNAQVADLQTQLADTAGRLAAEQAAHSADKAAAQAGLDAAQGRLSRLTSALQAVSTAVAAALAP